MATGNLAAAYWVAGQAQPEVTVNKALDVLDGLADVFVHAMASDADYTLLTTGTEPFEWQHMVIQITDAGSPLVLTTGRNIIVPDNTRAYLFKNETAQTLTLKNSGTGIAVATLKWALLRSDGTNVVRITPDA